MKNATKIELVITNRWGNVMHNAEYDLVDIAIQNSTSTVYVPFGWDGKSPTGADAQEGTYFFTYIVTGVDGESTKEGQGFVQLVRD